MDGSALSQIKYTEHRNFTNKVSKPISRSRTMSSGSNRPIRPRVPIRTRVVRVTVTDGNATDSSSNEDDDEFLSRQRVKKHINEIRIHHSSSRDNGNGRRNRYLRSITRSKVNSRKKVAAASIPSRRPCTKRCVTLKNFSPSHEEKSKPEISLTNLSGYNPAEESHNLSSPTSVFQFNCSSRGLQNLQKPVEGSREEEDQDKTNEPSHKIDEFLRPETPIFENFWDFEAPSMADIFDDASLQDNFKRDDFGGDFLGSDEDLGSSSRNMSDCFEDIGDFLVSDPDN